MSKYNTKINKFGRRIFLTGSLLAATTLGHPMMGQNSQDRDSVSTEYVNHEDSLYNVLLKRYSEYNSETAVKLAKKSTDAYLQLLDEGEVAQADTFMTILHENFEKKEVVAARKKAYTVNVTDSEKLRALKKNTASLYKKYTDLQKKFKLLDSQLEQMRKDDDEAFKKELAARDSAAIAEGIDPSTLPELKFKPSEKRLELELKHANNMDDLVKTQVSLSENDMILHEQQLKEDLVLKKEELKIIKSDIKLWEQLQKQIDKLQKQLDKFALVDYNPEKLNEKSEHDQKVAKESQETARENFERYKKLKELEKMKKALEKQQARIGTKEELQKRLADVKKEIDDIKAELKLIKRGKEVEIEAFKMDSYSGSDQQKAALGVKSDRGIATQEQPQDKSQDKTQHAVVKTGADRDYLAPTEKGQRRGTISSIPGAPIQANPSRTASQTTPSGSPKPAVATQEKTNVIQEISARIAEKKEEFEATSLTEAKVTIFDNGVIQTKYDMVGDQDALVLEWPNGKAAVIEGDTTTVYNTDGHVSAYIKGNNGIIETRDGNTVADSTVKTSVDVLRILNATGKIKQR